MKYKIFNFKNKNIDFTSIVLIFIFVVLTFKSPNLIQDSKSYIDNAFKRPPGYPLIIDFFQILFSNQYLTYLIIFQTFFGMIGIKYFINFFKKKYKLTKFLLFFLILIIAFPYLGVSMSLGNTIMSESVGYPVFLIFLILLFKKYIFQEKKIKLEFKFYLIFLILILIKKTFIFLLPIILILDFYTLIKIKKIKKIIVNFFFITIVIFVSGLLEKLNNYSKYDTFSTISVFGSSFVTAPFYLASDEDLMKISGKKNIEIVKFAKKKFEDEGIKRAKYLDLLNKKQNLKEFAKFQRGLFSDYFNKYVYMQWVFEHPIKKVFSELDNQEYKKASNQHCIEIAVQLFLLNPIQNTIFYFTNVTYGLGGYFILRNDLKGFYANVGFNGLNLLIINFLFLILIIFKNFNEKFSNSFYLIILTLHTIHISNVFAVSLFQPVYDRFSFFSNTLFIFSICLVLYKSIFYKRDGK